MKNAVIYQIFPERFYDADESNDKAQISARGTENYEYVNDWYTLPENPEQEERLTKEEYEAAVEAGEIDDDQIYFIKASKDVIA